MPIHLYQACNQDGATNISTVNTEERNLQQSLNIYFLLVCISTLDLPCFGVLGDLPALEQWEVAGPTSISDGHTINTHQTIVFLVIYLCMYSGAIVAHFFFNELLRTRHII